MEQQICRIAGGLGAVGIHSRSCNLHRGGTEVRETGSDACLCNRCHRNYIRQCRPTARCHAIAGGKNRVYIVVRTGIARCCEHHHTSRIRSTECVIFRPAASALTGETGIDRTSTLTNRIVDCLNDGTARQTTVHAARFQCHEFHCVHDSGDAGTIVADCANCARNVGAVAGIAPGGADRQVNRIHRLAVAGAKIVAEDIIHKSIIIVIDAVIGNFPRIPPHVGSQIRVIIGNAAIDDRDDHVGAAGGDIPGFWRIDINICCANCPVHGLPGIVKTPERGEFRVIRNSG